MLSPSYSYKKGSKRDHSDPNKYTPLTPNLQGALRTVNATRDVFISYGHADQSWVRTLANNLHQSGLDVFFDEWTINPGDVLVHKLEEGLRTARNGIVVVSASSLSRPWVQEEYAMMITAAVERGFRVIPVLIADAELPLFLANRVWVDFRHTDGPVYLERVTALTRRPGPPPRTGKLEPPPGIGFAPETTLHRTLRIDADAVFLAGDEHTVTGAPAGLDASFEQRCWELARACRDEGQRRDPDQGSRAGVMDGLLETVGTQLGAAFVPAGVAEALGTALAEAERRNCPLALALALTEPGLSLLPWETLRLPGASAALALHGRVNLYRRPLIEDKATAVSIPGPLRILVAVGSPEAQNARGELLDMEAELSRILDAVDAARLKGRAFVWILENGGVAAIREALEQQRYHVLYISCHARPGELVLENTEGREDRVTARRLLDEALPPGRGVPWVVLAGCSTGIHGEGELPRRRCRVWRGR